MEYKRGDILACKNNSYLSKFIRFLTKSKFSHLAIIVNKNEIIEADGIIGHICYRNISEYKNYADIYTCDNLTDEQRNNICKYAISKVGQKYDYYLLFVLFVKQVFGVKIRIRDGEKDICSELVNDAYFNGAGVILSKKRFPIPDDVIFNENNILRYVGSI